MEWWNHKVDGEGLFSCCPPHDWEGVPFSHYYMGKSLHSPLNLLFNETWKFHSAFKIVSATMCRLHPCAASGAQAANADIPDHMKLVIIHCWIKQGPENNDVTWSWKMELAHCDVWAITHLRCCKAAFQETLLGGGCSAESWHAQGLSVLNSQEARQYLKASLWNTLLAKAGDD